MDLGQFKPSGSTWTEDDRVHPMIDVHAHYLSPSLLVAADRGKLPIEYDAEHRILKFPSGPTRPVPEGLTSLDSRTTWMQARSIEPGPIFMDGSNRRRPHPG
jgi:hypothetical protein